MEDEENEENRVPDGGWGWVVVAGNSVLNMFNQTLLSVFGLLFGEHLHAMNLKSVGISLVSNLNLLGINLIGLFAGSIIKVMTLRLTALLSCISIFFGLLICSVSTKLWHVILGYSFMVGAGIGLIITTSFVAISTYFDDKKGRAVGISIAGTGLMEIFYPQITRILLDEYDFKIVLRVLAVLSLLSSFGALTFKPLNHTIKIQNDERSKSKSICERVVEKMDLKLLKDPVFWNVIMGVAVAYISIATFTTIFPQYLEFSVKLSRKDTALCMSVLGGADLITRFILPFITDILKIPYRMTMLCGLMGLFIFVTCLAESTELHTLLIFSVGYGVSKSSIILNNYLAVATCCTKSQIGGAIGLTMTVKAITVITIGPLYGWLRDYSESYSITFHVLNILLEISIISWLTELFYKCYKKRSLNKKINTMADNVVEEHEVL